MAVDYKNKYLDLRSKFAKTTDRYYRAGYEEGLKKGEQQAMQQQQEMMQQQQAMEAGVDPETGMPIEGADDENGSYEFVTQVYNNKAVVEHDADKAKLFQRIERLGQTVRKTKQDDGGRHKHDSDNTSQKTQQGA